MMWKTYLFKRISWLVLLMEKVGKAPKDRLCKKEIEMDTATTTEFMGVVCDYMDIFLQASVAALKYQVAKSLNLQWGDKS